MAKITRRSYGPDDPIFKEGPQVFVPVSRPSTATSTAATAGVESSDPAAEIPEEDDPRVGALRIARWKHQNQQFRKQSAKKKD